MRNIQRRDILTTAVTVRGKKLALGIVTIVTAILDASLVEVPFVGTLEMPYYWRLMYTLVGARMMTSHLS